jgi:hypothetical protein
VGFDDALEGPTEGTQRKGSRDAEEQPQRGKCEPGGSPQPDPKRVTSIRANAHVRDEVRFAKRWRKVSEQKPCH